jgi:anti-sigma-K factor RskA
MSDPRDMTPEEDADLLAAEFVLGVLDLEDRARAERLLRNDTEFASRVADWEVRFSGMNDSYEAEPPPDVMPRIEARLFPSIEPDLGNSAESRPRFFGWLLGALSAAAVILGAFVFLQPVQDASTVIATLGEEAAPLRFQASHDGANLTVTRVAGTIAPQGQVHELWLIAPEAAPVSLGLLSEDALTIPYPLPSGGWVLAVSLEPTGGSPTGAPTGPVLAAGTVTDL